MYEVQTLNQNSPIVKRALLIREKMRLFHPTTESPSISTTNTDRIKESVISPTRWYQPTEVSMPASNQQNWSKVELAPGRGSAYGCSGRTV